MKEEKFQKEILRRLDILIALLLEDHSEDKPKSITSKAIRLTELGLSPAEIASITGKPLNNITSALHKAKSRSKG